MCEEFRQKIKKIFLIWISTLGLKLLRNLPKKWIYFNAENHLDSIKYTI